MTIGKLGGEASSNLRRTRPARATCAPRFALLAVVSALVGPGRRGGAAGRHWAGDCRRAIQFLLALAPLFVTAAPQQSGLGAFAHRCFYTDRDGGELHSVDPSAWTYTLCFREPGVGTAWQQATDSASDSATIGYVRYSGRGSAFAISEGDVCPGTGRSRSGAVLAVCSRATAAAEGMAVEEGPACHFTFVITSSAACDLPPEPSAGPQAQASEGEQTRSARAAVVGVFAACLVVCYATCAKITRIEVRSRTQLD